MLYHASALIDPIPQEASLIRPSFVPFLAATPIPFRPRPAFLVLLLGAGSLVLCVLFARFLGFRRALRYVGSRLLRNSICWRFADSRRFADSSRFANGGLDFLYANYTCYLKVGNVHVGKVRNSLAGGKVKKSVRQR